MELLRFCFGNGKEINMKKSMPYILIVIRALIYGPSYLIYSVIATVMSNYCYAKIQASLAAALGGISTIVTIVVGVLFNHETLYLYHIVGTVMILGGALCMNLLPHDFRKKDNPSSGDYTME